MNKDLVMDMVLKKLVDLEREVANLKQKRIAQGDVQADQIKQRHIGEGPRFIRAGLLADLPTAGEPATASAAIYFATDTNTLYIWNGTAWKQEIFT